MFIIKGKHLFTSGFAAQVQMALYGDLYLRLGCLRPQFRNRKSVYQFPFLPQEVSLPLYRLINILVWTMRAKQIPFLLLFFAQNVPFSHLVFDPLSLSNWLSYLFSVSVAFCLFLSHSVFFCHPLSSSVLKGTGTFAFHGH